MFIEDDELREIYQVACAERMPRLERMVLRLEQNPEDTAALSEFLREAHTLKGDSRMLGVSSVERVTHHLEDLVGSIQQGTLSLNPEICDRIYTGLDSIQQWIHEAVTGEVAPLALAWVVSVIEGGKTATPAPPVDLESKTEITRSESLNGERTAVEDTANLATAVMNGASDFLPAIAADISPTGDFNADAFGDELLALIQAAESNPTALPVLVAEHSTPPIEQPPEQPLGQLPEKTPPPPAPIIEQLPEQLSEQLPEQPPEQLSEQLPEQLPEQTPEKPLPTAAASDTIRVDSQKLDLLMTQAGELRVTKRRLEQRLTHLESLLLLAEEWNRDAVVNRTALTDATAQNPLIAKFQQRSEQRLEQLSQLIAQLRNTVYEDVARLDVVSNELETGIQTLRLLPLSTLFNLYPRMVRDLAKQQGKEIQLTLMGGETLVDKRVLEELKDPLLHLIRNAIDHGIETPSQREHAGKPRMATLVLVGSQQGNRIHIQVRDDGRGLDMDAIRRTALQRRICREEELAGMTAAQIQALIFRPGFSTRTQISDLSGRGVGLDVVRSNVERLKGSLAVESELGQGCEFRLQLSTTLATTQVLIVSVNQTPYAIPIEFVELLQQVPREALFTLEGVQVMTWEGEPVSVAWLSDLLELPPAAAPSTTAGLTADLVRPCLMLRVGSDRLGLFVDDFLDQQDIILKPQSKLLQRVRNVTGATILGTGEVCIVLNPYDLIQSAQRQAGRQSAQVDERSLTPIQQHLLLVEDSLIIRTQMKRLLEGAGYAVTAAVDGLDGLQKLRAGQFNAVLSDVQMPNLDGLGLTAQIREHSEYADLPIVLLTTLDSEADQRRGADAGASAYLVKGAFDPNHLLTTLRGLL